MKRNGGRVYRVLGLAVTAGLAVCLAAAPALAARSTSAAFLKLGVGARAAGMGDAYTAQAHDASGLYWNTAGLAGLQRKQFIFMHNDWFGNINFEYLGYVHPMGDGSVLGGSFTYVDKGDIARTTYNNPFGAGLGSFTASDFAWGVAYARPYNENIDYGVMGKLIYQKLDDATATSFAVDLGMQYKNLYPGLTLGAALLNLGTAATFDEKKEQLPLLVKAGAAYRFPQFPLTVSSDLVFLRGDETSFRFGAEYELMHYLDLRAGYNSANDADNGFGLGFGINMDDLEINYAYVPYGDLGNTHRIDSVFTFGAIEAPPVVTPPVVTPPVTGPEPPVVAPPVTATPQQQARELVAQGNRQQAAGDAAGAAQTYLAALRLDPRSYAAYYNLGNAAFAMQDYLAAKNAYTYALTLKPGMLEAMNNLAGALYKLQDFAGAAKLWEAVVQRDPVNVGARHNLELLYRRHPEARNAAIGPVASVPAALLAPAATAAAPTVSAAAPIIRVPAATPPAATADARQVIITTLAAETPEQQARELVEQSNRQQAAGDAAGAAQTCLAALRLDPRSHLAYYSLGNATFALKDYVAAKNAFTYALTLKPGMLPAMNNLAGALYKLQDYAGAAKLWEAVVQRDSANQGARQNLELLYRRHPEARNAAIGPVASVPAALLVPAATPATPAAATPAAAAPAPRTRISAPPAPPLNVPPAPQLPAAVIPAISAPAPAVRAAGQPAVSAPAGAAPALSAAAQLVMRGNELAKQGDNRGAVQLYQQALQQDPRSYSAYYNLGNAAYLLHEYAAARAAYETALQLKPGSLETMNNLAGALYKLKEYTLAARFWERVLAGDPQNAATRANLDKVYERHPESRPQARADSLY